MQREYELLRSPAESLIISAVTGCSRHTRFSDLHGAADGTIPCGKAYYLASQRGRQTIWMT